MPFPIFSGAAGTLLEQEARNEAWQSPFEGQEGSGTEQQWCQLGWGGLERCCPAAEPLHSIDLPGVIQHGSSLGDDLGTHHQDSASY